MRNIPWNRDELILALDAYFRIQPRTPDPRLPEITELSGLLRDMSPGSELPDNFRSPSSVVMKLMNFRSFDPLYDGKGLEAAGNNDRAVWAEFAGDRSRLSSAAQAIRRAYATG